MTATEPRIWVLLGHRKGDNNQLLALAHGLGHPFETRSLRYNVLRRLSKSLLGRSLVSVEPDARKWIKPPWPDLVFGIGHRSVPVARYIRHASGRRAKIVQLGNPRLDPKHFDLVITMPQYGLRPTGRVLRLPLAMASPHPEEKATEEEHDFLEALPRPHRLMVIGGPNRHWRVNEADAAAAARTLMRRCDDDGGTLIVVGSPRTEPSVKDAVAEAIAGSRHHYVAGKMPRYLCLLEDADEIHVTADSVSMLSEAIFTGKPVGMIPVRQVLRGALAYGLWHIGAKQKPKPHLRAVWSSLKAEGLVGTVEAPLAGEGKNPVKLAVAAVRELLEQP
jgi:mitochondrial fission protein ELM1